MKFRNYNFQHVMWRLFRSLVSDGFKKFFFIISKDEHLVENIVFNSSDADRCVTQCGRDKYCHDYVELTLEEVQGLIG